MSASGAATELLDAPRRGPAISSMGRWDELRMAGELFGRSGFAQSDSPDVIELRRGRSRGLLAARMFVGLFLLPFFLLPLLLVLDPDIQFNVPAALFYVLWYGMLGGFTLIVSTVLFRWRTIRVDGRRGIMELEGSGHFLWFPRRVSIPLAAVRELQIRLGPEELRPPPFTWRLTYGPRGARARKIRVSATVETHDRREEAVLLTARISRLMGWEAFEIKGDDFGPAVRFSHSESSLDDPQPISSLEGLAARSSVT